MHHHQLYAKELPVIEELKKLNVEAMTPLEALNALAQLKKKAAGSEGKNN